MGRSPFTWWQRWILNWIFSAGNIGSIVVGDRHQGYFEEWVKPVPWGNDPCRQVEQALLIEHLKAAFDRPAARR